MGAVQTKTSNFETGLQIRAQFYIDVAGCLFFLCAKIWGHLGKEFSSYDFFLKVKLFYLPAETSNLKYPQI